MEMAKITTKGQITLPKKVRDKLDVDAGDNLVFIEKNNGYLIFSEKTIERGELVIDTTNSTEQ